MDNIDKKAFSERIERYKKMSQNKRRKFLGIRVNFWDKEPDFFYASEDSGYIRDYSFLLNSVVGNTVFSRCDRWQLLRRSRSYLSRRAFDVSMERFCPGVEAGAYLSVLDYFPALKHSYVSPLPGRVLARKRGLSDDFFRHKHVCYFDFCCNSDGSSSKARFNDLSRSGSIRLDPVDAPRQLFLYRRRIQRCISWGYSVGLVPLMMTVTVFHRWHPLRGLLNVLSKAWNHFFNASTAAVKRARRMGLSGYIRRAEETINNVQGGYNSGWHPHYHVILFVPADKVSVVASMEDELRGAWFYSVNRFFRKEFGESIDSAYEQSFREHGLFFSKVPDNHSQHPAPPAAPSAGTISNCTNLRFVDDSQYVAKILGCDYPSRYCGDNEMTSTHSKDSKVPFDLLLEDTAENVDLWVEYALATKGVRSFVFSHGLEARVGKYFEEHPDKDPLEPFVKSDKVIAQLDTRLYRIVARNFKVDEMMRVAVKGYEALCEWFRNFYIERGVPADDITDDLLPLPPNSRTPFGDVIEPLKSSSSVSDSSIACQQPSDSSSPLPAAPPSTMTITGEIFNVVSDDDYKSLPDLSPYTIVPPPPKFAKKPFDISTLPVSLVNFPGILAPDGNFYQLCPREYLPRVRNPEDAEYQPILRNGVVWLPAFDTLFFSPAVDCLEYVCTLQEQLLRDEPEPDSVVELRKAFELRELHEAYYKERHPRNLPRSNKRYSFPKRLTGGEVLYPDSGAVQGAFKFMVYQVMESERRKYHEFWDGVFAEKSSDDKNSSEASSDVTSNEDTSGVSTKPPPP